MSGLLLKNDTSLTSTYAGCFSRIKSATFLDTLKTRIPEVIHSNLNKVASLYTEVLQWLCDSVTPVVFELINKYASHNKLKTLEITWIMKEKCLFTINCKIYNFNLTSLLVKEDARIKNRIKYVTTMLTFCLCYC